MIQTIQPLIRTQALRIRENRANPYVVFSYKAFRSPSATNGYTRSPLDPVVMTFSLRLAAARADKREPTQQGPKGVSDFHLLPRSSRRSNLAQPKLCLS